jgi:hypothetical protein
VADQRVDDRVTATIVAAAGVAALLSLVTATLAATGTDPILCAVVLAVTVGVVTARIGNRLVCAIAVVAAGCCSVGSGPAGHGAWDGGPGHRADRLRGPARPGSAMVTARAGSGVVAVAGILEVELPFDAAAYRLAGLPGGVKPLQFPALRGDDLAAQLPVLLVEAVI